MEKRQERLLQFAVLLERQFLLLNRSIDQFKGCLRAFEVAVLNNRVELSDVADVLNFAHGKIDHLVRFQKIASALPTLSQKDVDFRRLRSSMGSLVDARNQIQHIQNDSVNNYTGPLLGSVSWVTDGTNFIAGFNDIGRQRSVPGLVFDTVEKRYTKRFCYVFGETYHDLEAAYDGVREFYQSVRPRISIEVDGKPYVPKDHLMAMAMSFKLPS